MNSHRFGWKTEKLNEIDGQLSFFDEVENCCDLDADEPELEIVVRKVRRKKQKGQRELDLDEDIQDSGILENLMPWSPELPSICKSKRR